MVIFNLIGGLGNQLFLYAGARCLAYKLNTELKIDRKKIDQEKKSKPESVSKHNVYRLGDFNIQATVATAEEIEKAKLNVVRKKMLEEGDFKNLQGDFFCQRMPFEEKYFADIRELLLKELTLKKPLSPTAMEWRKKILSAECAVSLHIRRGDYLSSRLVHIFGMLSIDYYEHCVAELKKSFSNLTAFVFSNDLAWVQENLKLDVPTEFVKGCESDNEDFVLMTLCKHNIISNSTFSWWAAWLNQNPDKIIFSPDHRGRNYTHEIAIPDSWIKIPVDYEKSIPDDVRPLLSIVFYVDKVDSRALKKSGIFDQTFRDYEIILVDDTADTDESISRAVESHRRATIIKESHKLGKAAAYNLALERSRGLYVLFLRMEDIILPEMNSRFGKLYDKYKKEITVFCFTRWLEESATGNKRVKNIKSKKFDICQAEKFKNLRSQKVCTKEQLQELKLTEDMAAFDLQMGATFFNGDFLKRNAIRFDENPEADFEASFVLNALNCSELTVFVPEAFYIAPRK